MRRAVVSMTKLMSIPCNWFAHKWCCCSCLLLVAFHHIHPWSLELKSQWYCDTRGYHNLPQRSRKEQVNLTLRRARLLLEQTRPGKDNPRHPLNRGPPLELARETFMSNISRVLDLQIRARSRFRSLRIVILNNKILPLMKNKISLVCHYLSPDQFTRVLRARETIASILDPALIKRWLGLCPA